MAEETNSQPPLKGLVLAGGDSSRMGMDKGTIAYHGKPQREYLYHLLEPLVHGVFISVREGQELPLEFNKLEDRYPNLGPFGALLTAFEHDQACAWLVVACDFPLLRGQDIANLISSRDIKSIGTSFLDPNTLMPEPWISILEPALFVLIQAYHQKGKSSLRGILVDYNSTVIRPLDPDILLNANTPEEAEHFMQRILRTVEK